MNQNSDFLFYLPKNRFFVVVINNTIEVIKLKNILKAKFFYKFVVQIEFPKELPYQNIGESKTYFNIKKRLKKIEKSKKNNGQNGKVEDNLSFFFDKHY